MLAFGLALLLAGAFMAASRGEATSSLATNQTGQPYWRRPGCFRVGHVRPIVIPGCLKFNLSTNACRGYCMSYSLPATDELQPLDEVVAVLAPKRLAPAPPGANQTPEAPLLELPAGSNELPPGAAVWISRHLPSGSGEPPQPPSAAPEPTSGAPTAEQQSEVVSVSQCCSMLETEDVIVHLRCVGQTEIRQFIFKSAKTCECFFCKKA